MLRTEPRILYTVGKHSITEPSHSPVLPTHLSLYYSLTSEASVQWSFIANTSSLVLGLATPIFLILIHLFPPLLQTTSTCISKSSHYSFLFYEETYQPFPHTSMSGSPHPQHPGIISPRGFSILTSAVSGTHFITLPPPPPPLPQFHCSA